MIKRDCLNSMKNYLTFIFSYVYNIMYIISIINITYNTILIYLYIHKTYKGNKYER